MNHHNVKRRGLTLVELLVVIVILTMVTAATIPLMAPATGARKVREAARLVAATLANAQARAISTGRPVGVWIQRISSQPTSGVEGTDSANQSLEMFLCEEPPPYAGESMGDTVAISSSGQTVTFSTPIPKNFVNQGDRIRFNYRGRFHTISALTPDATGNAYQSATITPNAQNPARVPFQIYSEPRKASDPPAQVPVGTFVDLKHSGIGDSQLPTDEFYAQNKLGQPVLVMFSSTGALDSVRYFHEPSNMYRTDRGQSVYLLIGQPNLGANPVPNHKNPENIWVAVNPHSGLVTSSEVAITRDYNPYAYTPKVSELQASREFARKAQNMTGR